MEIGLGLSNLRRYHEPGRMYFVTSVTYQRQPFLLEHSVAFRDALDHTKNRTGFDLVAWCLMPNHFHLLLEPNEIDISEIMRLLKSKFSGLYRSHLGLKRGRVWQNRFWDHMIRDQEDMNRHIDYIHYNPVKHGLCDNPFAHKHSSIHKFYEDGHYQSDWGKKEPDDIDGGFGE